MKKWIFKTYRLGLHHDDDDLRNYCEYYDNLDGDDEDDEVDNNHHKQVHCTELVGASSGNRSVKSSEIGATNKSLETGGVQSFQLFQYYFQAQFTFHQT